MKPTDLRRPGSTCALKRRIQRNIQQIEAYAADLRALAEEWEVSDFEELEDVYEGLKPWSYEALLLALLNRMNFYLAEATVTNWRESYAKYSPSKFNGDVSDPYLR